MWVHRSGEFYRERPIVLFEYQPGRDHRIPLEFYKDFHGILVTDGLSQYHLAEKKLDGVTNANCWVDCVDCVNNLSQIHRPAIVNTAHL